jgi:hypothetical protein
MSDEYIKDVKDAINNVSDFISRAKEVMAERMEAALRDIAKLENNPEAKDIAERTLGIGKYSTQP